MEINYGVMADKLYNQLKKQGYKDKKIDKHERLRFSINMLFLHGYITEKQKHSYFVKLHKDIEDNLKEF